MTRGARRLDASEAVCGDTRQMGQRLRLPASGAICEYESLARGVGGLEGEGTMVCRGKAMRDMGWVGRLWCGELVRKPHSGALVVANFEVAKSLAHARVLFGRWPRRGYSYAKPRRAWRG